MLRTLVCTTFSLVLAAQTPAPAPQAPAAPAPVKEDKVLATLGTTAIRESDFDLFLAVSLPEQQRAQVMMMPGAREQYLKRFLDYRILAAKARKEGIAKAPDFAKKMQLMEMQVLIQSLFDRDGNGLKAKSTVKDEDVKAYFDKHPDKFMTPENFSARHILVSTRAQGTEKARTDEEAKARIKEIQEALKAGKSFEELAKTYSDDPGSKDRGGLYDNMPFGRFVPEFDKAVRDQKAGEVGEPVKSMHGYHLIKVEKITPAVPQTFEAAKESAKQMAATDNQEKVMNEYMDAARKEVGFHEGAAPAAKAAPAPKAKKGAK
ncbi:peptidylprolyl isomerase [Mesoterricola silvestris]|uniref:Peptidylprolyl isomerase n=1 Tax=Mesoterricola silvestris TaxID=2927979 RepID=A0AA48GV82_9BACT|nr:peptidylprolyl isomerase [Mesoterricola silvestris]BDU70948.1 peptidylprolyl isomerase [Mesoterricola silvestris]